MNCKSNSIAKKFLSAALSLTVAFGASAVTLPAIINTGSIDVSAAASSVSINSTSVTLYAMNGWASKYISIPSSYKTKYQLKVTGASKVTYSTYSGNISVSENGLIEPKFSYIYYYREGDVTYYRSTPWEGKTPTKIERTIDFDPATVTVKADDKTFNVSVTLNDYVELYVEKVLDDYVKSDIKSTMTTYEKCVKIAEFIAARDYSASYSSTAGLVVAGEADCWGSTETAIRLAKKAGLQSWVRNGNRDPGSGSGHKNAIVYDGKEIYVVDAGYTGKAPRYYDVIKHNSFWSYRSAGSNEIELYQYDGEIMPEILNVPSSLDGKKVVGLGYNFISLSRGVKQVVLPDTIRYIGKNAFYGCTSLEKINFPAGLEKIDERAFGECYGLKTVSSANSNIKYVAGVIYNGTTAVSCPTGVKVNLRSGTKVIGAGSFAYSNKLESVTIPSSVESIGEGAFSQCYNFSSLTINSTKLTSIGSYALAYNNMKYIILPDSVTTISPHAFDTYSGNNADMLLVGKAGGAVEKYAKENGHSFLDSSKAVKNTSSVGSATVVVGDTVNVKVSYSGGKAPYTIEGFYRYQTDSALSENKLAAGSNSFSFKADRTGCYVVTTVVTDGYGIRQEKTINVTVKSELANNSTVSSTKVTKGQTIVFTGKASGGIGGYTYALDRKNSNGSWNRIKAFSSNATMNYTCTSTGTISLRVAARDSRGKIVYKYFTVKVNPAPLVLDASISSEKTLVNRALLVQATAAGGVGNYQFALDYKKDGDKNWTSAVSYGSSAYMVFNPQSAGKYTVRTAVKDAAGTTTYCYLNVEVGTPIALSVTAPTNSYAGNSCKVTASASGGFGTYSYKFRYRLEGESSWRGTGTYGTSTAFSFTPSVPGTYQVQVYARDVNKFSKSTTITIKVVAKKLYNNSKMRASTVNVGKTATVDAASSGGYGTHKYSVSVYFPVTKTWRSFYTNTTRNTLSFAATEKGKYYVKVTVKDDSGQSIEKTITFDAI